MVMLSTFSAAIKQNRARTQQYQLLVQNALMRFLEAIFTLEESIYEDPESWSFLLLSSVLLFCFPPHMLLEHVALFCYWSCLRPSPALAPIVCNPTPLIRCIQFKTSHCLGALGQLGALSN
ncbi:hypothetical protein AMEX_G13491 [Astyanax mexicanus]|uniref:Uncharacterized protein n=1 Tax=Astyanax mexicanus TaxID=7994 RepID=A0A8T2LL15_ASTMX|nr:hypothetical protein AMEX_G13491 [Astyanax mexicanus]